MEFTKYSLVDIKISFKAPKTTRIQIIWDELATNLQGVKFYVGWIKGCSYAIIPSPKTLTDNKLDSVRIFT